MLGVTDVRIVAGDKTISCPAGYNKVAMDLNQGSGGKFIYLCQKTGNSQTGITDVTVIDGKSAICPSGYVKDPTDLNLGAGGNTLYMCKKTELGQPLLRDVTITSGATAAPSGYTKIPVDLNKGAGGATMYMWKKPQTIADMCAVGSNLSLQTCKDRCIASPGTCDLIAAQWCASHPQDGFCGCMNSTFTNPKYGINPKCVDPKCLAPGTYLSSTQNSTNCPAIVNCDIQVAIKNDGYQIGTSIPIQQNCGNNSGGGGGTTTQPPPPTPNPTPTVTPNIWIILLFVFLILIACGLGLWLVLDDDEPSTGAMV